MINAGERTPSLKIFLSHLAGRCNPWLCAGWWVLWGRWKLPACGHEFTYQSSTCSVSSFSNCGSKA